MVDAHYVRRDEEITRSPSHPFVGVGLGIRVRVNGVRIVTQQQ